MSFTITGSYIKIDGFKLAQSEWTSLVVSGEGDAGCSYVDLENNYVDDSPGYPAISIRRRVSYIRVANNILVTPTAGIFIEQSDEVYPSYVTVANNEIRGLRSHSSGWVWNADCDFMRIGGFHHMIKRNYFRSGEISERRL